MEGTRADITRTMVDLATALKAAAADDRRKRGSSDEKKKPGGKVGVEPFNPIEQYEKEVADSWSMWLVILFGLGVSLIMRYVVMPMLDGEANVLWSLPLLLALTVPTLHKAILRKFADKYTFSNWFRAIFLYIFTWLAVTFIVVNPPLADLAPPEVGGKIFLVDSDDPNSLLTRDLTITLDENQSGTADSTVLVFSIRDNLDTDSVMLAITVSKNGQLIENRSLAGGIANFTSGWAELDGLDGNESRVAPHERDVPVVIPIGSLDSGAQQATWKVVVTMSQQGNPWHLEYVKTITITVVAA